MFDQFLKTIKENNLLDSNEVILVGVSGGIDSMVLLDLLVRLIENKKDRLKVVHLNHNLRGSFADRDQSFVQDYCFDKGIEFYTETVNVTSLARKQGISIEEAGRLARHSLFQRLMEQTGAEKVFLAHHKDDQAETVLMRIIRGTGLDGLVGMTFKDGYIIRPLLPFSKAEILDHAQKWQIPYIEDHTNYENIYTRNKLRNDLIPKIETEYNPKFQEAILKLSKIASESVDVLERYISNLFEKAVNTQYNGYISLDARFLCSLDQHLQIALLRHVIALVQDNLYGFERSHFEQFRSIIDSKTGKIMEIGGIVVSKAFDELIIYKKMENSLELPIEVNAASCYYANGFFIQVDPKGKSVLLRKRQAGDRITLFDKEKKLKDFLIDKKIKQYERDFLPIIEIDGKIACVANLYENKDLVRQHDIKLVKNGGYDD